MKKIIVIFVLLSILCLSGCSLNEENELKNKLQLELDRITNAETIPGATFCVLLPNNKTLNISSGYSDIENNVRMNPDDIMFSASIGKTYVASIILKLEKENKLSLNNLVKKYFEDDEWFSQIPNANDITIEMLLNHTSGIPEYYSKQKLQDLINKNPDKEWTGKERLSFIFKDKPLHSAGKAWKYSDTNYIILGMIIEKITGRAYYDTLKEQILEPLNLTNTSPADKRIIKGLIPGYTLRKEPFNLPEKKVTKNHKYFINPQLEWTGGGVVTTSADLAKWAKKLYNGDFLSEEIVARMTISVKCDAVLPPNTKYGYGTIIWELDSNTCYGHTGFIPGYISIMQYIPQYDISLAMQINTDILPNNKSLVDYLSIFREIIINY